MLRFILTDYVEQAMALAIYDKLEDGSFIGRIPPCKGVIAFASTLRECENELRSTLYFIRLCALRIIENAINKSDPEGILMTPKEF
jgi:hypothetical protein